jgi:hypothetical protein
MEGTPCLRDISLEMSFVWADIFVESTVKARQIIFREFPTFNMRGVIFKVSSSRNIAPVGRAAKQFHSIFPQIKLVQALLMTAITYPFTSLSSH